MSFDRRGIQGAVDPRCGDTGRRLQNHHAALRCRAKICENLSNALTSFRAARDAVRHIGAQRHRELLQLSVRGVRDAQRPHTPQCSRRIRAAARHACRRRDALDQFCLKAAVQPISLLHGTDRPHDEIVLSCAELSGFLLVLCRDLQRHCIRAFLRKRTDRQRVENAHRLHDHIHQMITVTASAGDIQSQI